ncbi:MAG: methyltransferase domain-containing protein [Sedimentisphaerales bacterium]|nr:methyltransferase domain-containing protein [Sedimentisphaerales bacterium]
MVFKGFTTKIYKLAKSCSRFTPAWLQSLVCILINRLNSNVKYSREGAFWCSRDDLKDGKLCNTSFRARMLPIAGEENADFLKDKIVADFGCGPRGSLHWCTQARIRIGIDVLVDNYARWFDIKSHDMCYICCSEDSIPLPSNYVDVLFTMNALDHVRSFKRMCREIIRILAPGGEFIGSINLRDRATITEPQIINEKRIKKYLLQYLEVGSYRLDPQYSPEENERINEAMGRQGTENTPVTDPGTRVLWIRARKPK